MNSICPMNFFRTTDTTIWKPGLNIKGGMGSNVQGVSRSHALSKSNLFVAICLACPTNPPLLCFPASNHFPELSTFRSLLKCCFSQGIDVVVGVLIMVSLYNCLDMTFSCVWEEISFLHSNKMKGCLIRYVQDCTLRQMSCSIP